MKQISGHFPLLVNPHHNNNRLSKTSRHPPRHNNHVNRANEDQDVSNRITDVIMRNLNNKVTRNVSQSKAKIFTTKIIAPMRIDN